MSQDEKKASLKHAMKTMNEERPLDALFPELTAPYAPNDGATQAESSEPMPVGGTQVLDVELEDAQHFALVCWRAPKNDEENQLFARDLEQLVQVTLLQELSRPPGWGGAVQRHLEALDVFVFEALSQDHQDTLRAMGFVPEPFDVLKFGNRLHAWKNEAKSHGWSLSNEPTSLWRAPLRVKDNKDSLTQTLRNAHEELAQRYDSRLWGAYPGEPSHALASILERELHYQIKPDMESLQKLDMLIVEREPNRFRWIEPMIFQGLCDFMGIILMANKRARVQWGLCESDQHGGHFPPLFRLSGKGGARDVEVGRELLKHAVMPRLDGDQELLSQWFERVFFS